MVLTEFLTDILTRSYEIVYRYGYVGLFLISFIETASLSFFPLPTMFFVFTFGGILNPFLVGIVSGLGAGIGCISGYVFGRGFKDIVEKKYGKKLEKTRETFDKHKGFLWVVILGATPFMSTLLALFCGMIKYDIRKYALASIISKICFNLIFAYAGYYSVTWVLNLVKFNLPSLI